LRPPRADLAGRWAPQILTAVAALAAVTVLGTAQIVAHGAMPQPNHLNESTVTVAQRLRGEEPCLLVTGYEPTMGWYSGCDAVTYAQFRAMNPTGRVKVSLVLFEHGTRQPGALSLKRLIGDRDTTTRRIPAGGSIGAATVITLK
jgi:hypothetical protein